MKRRRYIFLFVFAMLLPMLLMREYTPSNELRYLNIVDDAIENGRLFAFYDHATPYADKPPLYFWLAMLLKKIAGGHYMVLLATLLSLVPAFVICSVMDRWLGDKLSEEARSAAMLMLLSSILFLASSIVLRMDMLMTMFIVLAVRTFWRMYCNKKGAAELKAGEHTHSAKIFRRDSYLLPIYIFLAIFSKGAIGFLAPLLIIIIFLIINREWRIWRYLGLKFWGILLALCALWFTGVYLDGGKEYLNNLLFHQTIERGINSFHHKGPFWYYLISYWWITAPWALLCVVIAVMAIAKKVVADKRVKLCATAALTIFVMLSIISSKLAIYLLPALPFIIYCTAFNLEHFKESKITIAIMAFPPILFLLTLGLSFFAKEIAAAVAPQIELPKLRAPYSVLLLPLAVGSVLTLRYLKYKRVYSSISALAASLFVTIFVSTLSMKEINSLIGVKEGCLEAAQIAKAKNKELLYYSWGAGNNLDYYFKQKGLTIKEIDAQELKNRDFSQKGAILFFKARRIKRDSLLRELLYTGNQNEESFVQLGDNIAYKIF